MKVLETTPLIEINLNRYPVYLADVRRKNPGLTLQEGLEAEKLKRFGFAVVRETQKPTDHVVIEGAPELQIESGDYFQTWFVEPESTPAYVAALQVRKLELFAALEDLRNATEAKGLPYEFPDGYHYHVQMAAKDRSNIHILRTASDDYIAAGYADAPVMVFRTWENITVPMTPAQIKVLTAWTLSTYISLAMRVWSIVDEIKRSERFEDLPAIPEVLEPQQ